MIALAAVLLLALSPGVTPEQYGAVGDDSTDDSPAFDAARDAMCTKQIEPVLNLQAKTYRLSRAFDATCTVKIVGTNDGKSAPSQLHMDKDRPCVTARRAAGNTELSHFTCASKGGTDATAHGLIVQGPHFRAEQVRVSGFPGNGIHFDCDLALGSDCSGWRLYDVAVEQAAGFGVWTRGGDANSGLSMGLDVRDCKGGGISARDFLGSVWIGGLIDETAYPTVPAIVATEPNARGMFLGQYVEGANKLQLVAPNMWIGGLAGDIKNQPVASIADGAMRNLKLRDRADFYAAAPGATTIHIENYRYPGSWPLQLRYEFNKPKWYQWVWANQQVGLEIADYGVAIPQGQVALRSGLWTGPGTDDQLRRVVHWDGAPKSGTWKQGDATINRLAKLGTDCALYLAVQGGDFADPDLTKRPKFGCVHMEVTP